jgi:hypothetical protein
MTQPTWRLTLIVFSILPIGLAVTYLKADQTPFALHVMYNPPVICMHA